MGSGIGLAELLDMQSRPPIFEEDETLRSAYNRVCDFSVYFSRFGVNFLQLFRQ